jgi:hypothetical protein
VDLRAGLDDLEKRKFLILPGLELRPFGRPALASRFTDYAIPAPWTVVVTDIIVIMHDIIITAATSTTRKRTAVCMQAVLDPSAICN